LTGDDLLGELLSDIAFLLVLVLLVAFPGNAVFAGVTAFAVFFGEAFFAVVIPFEGEVFFVTLPVCTWSTAASCAFAEGTARLGELLVVLSGLVDLDFAGLAGDVLVGFAGEVLRPAFAGVPSARDFAIAGNIQYSLYPTERERAD
jgi:hypothetical protein